MDSKISLKIIFVIFTIFIGHIFLYFFIPSYWNYFKDIKYNWDENSEITDNTEVANNKKIKNNWFSSYTWSNYIMPDINEDLDDNLWVVESDIESNNKLNSAETEENIDSDDNNIDSNTNNALQEIIDLFTEYDLKEKEETQNSSLFWLTNEYPYEYDEYYSREMKMNLYYFKDKSYTDILNIFDVISYNLFFKIKKVNNFWEKSFYLNLDPDLDDNYIRFVFSYKNNNFGLKIKKDWYNDVKKILKAISKKN